MAADQSIGGLLILGAKGTGKSSLVRAFADLLPDISCVKDCLYGCDPADKENMCPNCRSTAEKKQEFPSEKKRMRIVELPIGATDDRVIGSINVERTLKEGKIRFEPGLLASANRSILYIDEVNLLPDHIVDLILDAAAFGWAHIEREGISLRHPAKFILIGTMNPEEGELRPQLLDRFAVSVKVQTMLDPMLRAEIVKRNIRLEEENAGGISEWENEQQNLRKSIEQAHSNITGIQVPEHIINTISVTCGRLLVDGYRPDIVATKIARAQAALAGKKEPDLNDALWGLQLSLGHRTRAGGLKPPPTPVEIEKAFGEAKNEVMKMKAPQPQGFTAGSASVQGDGKASSRGVAKSWTAPPGFQPDPPVLPSKRPGFPLKTLLSLGILAAAVLLIRLFVPFLSYLVYALLAFLGLVALLSILLRKKSGDPFTEPFTPGRRKARRFPVELSPMNYWPRLRSVAGRKVTDGRKVIEYEIPEGDYGPPLQLERALAQSRWLGRKKAKKGGGLPIACKFYDPRTRDVSFPATFRHAARHGKPFAVQQSDLRSNVREGRVKTSMILVLDSSESMIDSIAKVREAVKVIKRRASRMRDRVSLIVFKGQEAYVLQHPSTNFNLILQKLRIVGLSDFTPLAAGMLKSVGLARAEQSRGYSPVILIVSDGVTNVSVPRFAYRVSDIPDPATDALLVSRMIALNKWSTVAVNMNHLDRRGPSELAMGTRLMKDIAKMTKGVYIGFSHKGQEQIILDMSGGYETEIDETSPYLEAVQPYLQGGFMMPRA